MEIGDQSVGFVFVPNFPTFELLTCCVLFLCVSDSEATPSTSGALLYFSTLSTIALAHLAATCCIKRHSENDNE